MRKKLDYTKIMRRDDSLLASYVKLYENVETSEAYDFWSAVWLLFSTIGRKVVVARPHAPVFLNTYVILCAESGITRKSTAVNGAVNMLATHILREDRDIALVQGGTTAEGLDNILSHNGHAAIVSSELVNLLGKERYNASLPGRLTD